MRAFKALDQSIWEVEVKLLEEIISCKGKQFERSGVCQLNQITLQQVEERPKTT